MVFMIIFSFVLISLFCLIAYLYFCHKQINRWLIRVTKKAFMEEQILQAKLAPKSYV